MVRRSAPEWLVPAAVALCVISVAAVIWIVLFGGDSSAAASVGTSAKAATAEAAPTTDEATASQTNAKGPTAKGKGAERDRPLVLDRNRLPPWTARHVQMLRAAPPHRCSIRQPFARSTRSPVRSLRIHRHARRRKPLLH